MKKSDWIECRYDDLTVGDEVKTVVSWDDGEVTVVITDVVRRETISSPVWLQGRDDRAAYRMARYAEGNEWNGHRVVSRAVYRRYPVKTYKIEGLTEEEVQDLRDIAEATYPITLPPIINKIQEEA